MLKRCPQLIDYLRYTETRKIVEGEILLSECARLVDLVSAESDLDQVINFKLEFGIDEFANRFLKGLVTSQLKLTCQRCMDALDYPIDIELALAFIKKKEQEQDIVGLYESFYVENKDAKESIDVYALIEDEIILSLPLIAKHQYQNCMSTVETADSNEIDSAYLQEQANKKNPFAVLEQLKNSKN